MLGTKAKASILLGLSSGLILPNLLTPPPLVLANAEVSCSVPGRSVDSAYFSEVLTRLSIPPTSFAVKALAAWVPYEDTSACWNPLATTQPAQDSTHFNAFPCASATGFCHVQNYGDRGTGTMATARTLANGYYDPVLRMLRRQSFERDGLRQALCVWAGGCVYADRLIRDWQDLWNDPGTSSAQAPLAAQGSGSQPMVTPPPAASLAAPAGPAQQPAGVRVDPVPQQDAPAVDAAQPSLVQRVASWFLDLLGRIGRGFSTSP